MTLDRKTFLVTGSTDGVGRVVARRLGRAGATVLIHGRDRERGERLREEIISDGGKAAFHQADLGSLAEVRRLASEVASQNADLHCLINNAGIGSGGPGAPRAVSAEGHELRFAVNYLSGFLLACLLLPTLRRNAPARIVNVTSQSQHPIDFDDVMLTRAYDGLRAYRQSKLAQVMFTIDLAEELRATGVTANVLHPASFMDTTMMRQGGNAPRSTVEDGADTIMHVAASEATEGQTGLYFHYQTVSQANPQAYDQAAREKLRALSLKLTGLA